MGMIFDAVSFFLMLGMTYALSSEGLWGAALMFFNALFAALITMNFYEPLAQLIGTNVEFLSGFADALCIMVLFTVSLLLLRLATESLAPAMVRFPTPLYHLGRFAFAVGGSALTMGMILIALDASPVNKKILGSMDYKSKPFYGVRLDKEILAFFQHSTGYIFTRGGGEADPYGEFKNARVFDPRGDWLIRAQEARPYPKGQDIFADEAGGAAEGGAAAPAESGGPPGPGGPGTPAKVPGPPAGLAPAGGLH